MIQLRGLDAAEVRTVDDSITPDSAMLFALALFLGVHAGERVYRARLLDLFWPHAPDGSRRHALRQLLYRMRRAGIVLELDGEELLLPADQVDSDLQRVLGPRWADEASAEEIISAGNCLPGYEPPESELFREWLDELRSRVGAHYRRGVLRMIGAARREGRWRDADDWARRCLDIDPLNEEATLARAEAVAMTGSKADALQIIDAYLAELGERDRVIGLPARMLRRRVSERFPARERNESDVVPLFGREAEMSRLNDELSSTLAGRGTGVFVTGAAGIGKSRLADELMASAAMRGWRSVSARQQSSDVQRPLGLFGDLMTLLLQLSGAIGCSPESLGQLRLLTERNASHEVDRGKSQEAEAVQERLRNAGAELVESVASEGPVLMLLEDLHWCDDASREMLQHLVAKSGQLAVFWMMTARAEGSYGALREMISADRVGTLRVGPLAPGDATALFRALIQRQHALVEPLPAPLMDAVTGGNPLFIRELVRHVRDTGQTTTLPPSLRALIHSAAQRLSPLALNVLHTCAVLGRYSSVPRVAAVLELGTPSLLACIDELDALGIVGVGRNSDALVLHDLWQDELLSSLLAAGRALLHHRCGEVLEAECRVSRSPSLVWAAAQHFIASGSEGRALGLLEECGQHQMDNGLPGEAARTFQLAVEASTSDVDRFRAMNGRIAALRRTANWTELAVAIGPAIELGRRVTMESGPHTELELLETEVLWRSESDLRGSLRRSLACTVDEAAPSNHRANAALLAAIVADNVCDFKTLAFVETIACKLTVSSSDALASQLSIRLIRETVMGSLEQANECGRRLVSFERTSGSVRGLARALRFAANPLQFIGEFTLALEYLSEALDIAETHHLAGDAASASDAILLVYFSRGDLEAAQKWMPRVQTLFERVNARYTTGSTAVNRAMLALMLGDAESAFKFIEPHIPQISETDPLVRQQMHYVSILSRVFVARNDHASLRSVIAPLKAALALRRTTGPHDFHVASYGLALLELGNRVEAEDYVQDFLTRARRDRTQPSRELLAIISSA